MASGDRNGLVAVTGIGMICPLGITASACWENLLQGKSGIRRITKFDAGTCGTQIGGQLPEAYFELEQERTSKRLYKKTVLAARLMRLCAQEAIADSALPVDHLDPHRCGVIAGTSGSSVRSHDDLGGPGTEKFRIVREMINAMPAWISLDYGFKGPTFTIAAAAASGAYAIARAYDLIRWGVVDVAVVGGVDNLLTKNNIRRGNAFKVLSQENCEPEKAMRPFDQTRSGFVISDGGCAVVLESYEHAMQRQARVYAWMQGYGALTDSYSWLNHTRCRDGIVRSMDMALNNAKVPKQKIGYISANGTSGVIDDVCETAAIKQVFGKHAANLLVSSQKSMLGHTIGSSSALEFAVTALVLNTQHVPPTINYAVPDPECDLNYVPNTMVVATDLKAAMSNCFGFGGHHAVMVLSRFP